MAKINKPDLIKCEVGGCIDIWGYKLNDNIDKTSTFMDEVIVSSEDHDQELARLEKDKVDRSEVDELVETKVDNYIDNNVKPELDKYIAENSKPNLDAYVEQKKSDLDKYNNEVKKPELDNYTNEKKKELDTHTNLKKEELNSHTTKKEQQLDTYTETKKTEINDHTAVKIKEIDSHVEEKKIEINQHTDNEKNRLTEELNAHVNNKKQELDSYEKEKEGQLDTYTTTKEQQLNAYTVEKQEQLDIYEKNKETELGQYAETERESITNHTTEKITEITKHTDSEKLRLTAHTDSEIKRVTDETTIQVNRVTVEGDKQVERVVQAGEGLTPRVDALEKGKLDKGEGLSEEYNTAKKIEDIIEGQISLVDSLGDSVSKKLEKGNYNGTAEDLKNAIDNVVNLTEKTIAGKGLVQTKDGINNTINIVSKNEGIVVNDNDIELVIVNDFTGGANKPLSAEKGRELNNNKVDVTTYNEKISSIEAELTSLDSDKLDTSEATKTYVKKTGDEMTGQLISTKLIVKSTNLEQNNPQYQLILNNEIIGILGYNGTSVYLSNQKSNKLIELRNDGTIVYPANNLLTISKEVVGGINELYNLLVLGQPTNPNYHSFAVSRDENNSSPTLTYTEK